MDTWMWCIYGAPLLIKRSSRGEIVVMVVGSAQQPRKWTMDAVLVLMLSYNYSFISAYKVAKIYYFSSMVNILVVASSSMAGSEDGLPGHVIIDHLLGKVCENDLNNKTANRKFFCISS